MYPYFCRGQELADIQGLLYWEQQVVIPEAAREELLKLLREAHRGTTVIKGVARTLLWWPDLGGEMEQLTRIFDNWTQAAPMLPT